MKFRAVIDDDFCAETLVALAPHLPREVLPEAFTLARGIEGEEPRIKALAGLAPHLSPEERPAVLAEALATAGAIRGVKRRVDALTALALHLPPEERPTVLAEALVSARTIGDERSRAEALARLAPHLPDAKRITVLEEVIEDCARLRRSEALAIVAQLAPVLAEVGGGGSMSEIVWAIRDVGRWWP